MRAAGRFLAKFRRGQHALTGVQWAIGLGLFVVVGCLATIVLVGRGNDPGIYSYVPPARR
jgi:hypothetical protein